MKSVVKNKKGAIELSMTTIVIVVLAMAMLVLGLVLIKTIFQGTTSVASMTNDQVKNQIAKLFDQNHFVKNHCNSIFLQTHHNFQVLLYERG